MNIILESNITDAIRNKYLLLELDSFRLMPNGHPVPAFCLLDQVPLNEMLVMQQYLDLHANLMPNYRRQNWPYVEQAIEHLMGRWDNQLDSFYKDVLDRVQEFKQHPLDDAWDGIIDRFSNAA
jgi:hypothetical protein